LNYTYSSGKILVTQLFQATQCAFSVTMDAVAHSRMRHAFGVHGQVIC